MKIDEVTMWNDSYPPGTEVTVRNDYDDPVPTTT